MAQINFSYEQIKVLGKHLISKIGELLHAGNVRRIIIKDDRGKVFLEVPITIAAVGLVATPLILGLGAIAAMVAHFTLVIERTSDQVGPQPWTPGGPSDAPSLLSRVEKR